MCIEIYWICISFLYCYWNHEHPIYVFLLVGVYMTHGFNEESYLSLCAVMECGVFHIFTSINLSSYLEIISTRFARMSIHFVWTLCLVGKNATSLFCLLTTNGQLRLSDKKDWTLMGTVVPLAAPGSPSATGYETRMPGDFRHNVPGCWANLNTWHSVWPSNVVFGDHKDSTGRILIIMAWELHIDKLLHQLIYVNVITHPYSN